MNFNLPTNLKDKYDHLIVHVTATPPSMTEVDADWVDRMHRRKGWSGCGYHALITRDAELQHEPTGYRTRPYARSGAHVGGCGPGWNGRSLGITMAGGVLEDGRTPADNTTDEQKQLLWSYIREATLAFDIDINNVIGHRDLIKMTNSSPKACPCFSVQNWIGTRTDDLDRLDFTLKSGPAPRGDKLKTTKTYTVRSGDSLWSISNTFGVPLRTLQRLNPNAGDIIHPGQKLRLLG